VWLSISVHHPPMWTRPFVSTRKHDFQLQISRRSPPDAYEDVGV
jgi:hypothetical protein